MPPSLISALLAAVVALLVGLSPAATAAGPGSAPRAEAAPPEVPVALRATFEAARLAWEEGNAEEALRLLREAEGITPDPVVVYSIGLVLEDLGRPVEAYETYLRVTATRDVPTAVRELAAQRLARLRPLAVQAVIELSALAPEVGVWLDGQPLERLQPEVRVDPGRHVLVLVRPDACEYALLVRDLPARARLLVTPPPAADPAHGSLRWQSVAGLTELRVDAQVLPLAPPPELPPTRVSSCRLRLPAGEHRVEALHESASPYEGVLTVPGGGEVDLSALLRARWQPPAPAPAPRISRTPIAAVVGLVVGVVMAGGGAVMVGVAELDRDRVRHALGDADGPVTEMTQRRAYRLRDEADTLAPAGAAILGVGGALCAAGAIWWAVASLAGVETEASAEVAGPRPEITPAAGGGLWVRF